MKALIRIIIAALVVHATWRVGTVYWRNYQFRDGVQQTAQFSGRRSDDELRYEVLELAKAYSIPVDPERVSVSRRDNHTLIDVSYDERLELLPRYFYPWRFDVNIDAFTITPEPAQP
ncbi:MAG TPA: hypothetical protein VJM31_05480 [Vicinamibacterales bacterium]|nr:hypothetical protein [Vicinamibacterales bacterium]